MRLRFDDEAEAFRGELREWLDANQPTTEEMAEPKLSSAHYPEWARAWQRRQFDDGWLVPGWPPELGGRNATPVQQMVYFEELARRQLVRSANPQGLSIITPSIVDHGTPEQRERYALPTLRAELSWCLGMSEPGAGSDLASLATRAVRDGDRFVVNGQKVWTSGAHHSDYCFCFVRTDPDVPKHKGISCLVIDMRTPGITCRPLPELTEPDWADFNEVFFTDVMVPAENLVGELNQGWRLANGSLAHERGMLWITNVANIERTVEHLVALGKDTGAAADDRFRDAVAQGAIDAMAMRLLGYKGFGKFAKGEFSVEHTLLKLFSSETERRLYLVGTEALEGDGIDTDRVGPPVWREGSWVTQYLRAFSGTIAGGTSEIQRNIIAERVLGLPR
ncbi:MAG: acyl-CoA dehydrogenase [Acidimicrobiales bacterium]|jgi:alkylation response protein AidB-like acyl-CoA dehydrogenase|nr:acyl-CoA dehydrogenase [Acidimicrobiales bacterium]